MAGGRPTKLNKELVAKAAKYDYKAEGQVVPTIEGLALFLDINRDTLREWTLLKTPIAKEFSAIVKKNMDLQALELVNKGLKGTFNSRVTNMMLSKHGYIERKEQDVTHTGTVQFVNDVPRPKDS